MKKENRKNKILYFLKISSDSLYNLFIKFGPQRFSKDESGLNSWKSDIAKYLGINTEEEQRKILEGLIDPIVVRRAIDWSIISTFFPLGEEIRKLWRKKSDNSIQSFSSWIESSNMKESNLILSKLLNEIGADQTQKREEPSKVEVSPPAIQEQKSPSGENREVASETNKPGRDLGDSKKNLIKNVTSAVLNTESRYKIPKGVIFGQWALESSYGRKDIGGYNYFGIKGSGSAGSTSAKTNEEYQSGRVSRETSNFAKYKDMQDGFNAYGEMLSTRPRYKYATEAFSNNPAKFIIWIWGRGYATDSQYPMSIARTAKSIEATLGDPSIGKIGWDYTPEELDLIQRMSKLDAGKERYDLVTRELGPKN